MEVSDVSLKAVIGGAVFFLKGALSEGAELIIGSDFNVEQVEGGFEVGDKLIESFLGVGNGGVGHLIIPILCVRCSSPTAHLVQGGHDFGGVRGV